MQISLSLSQDAAATAAIVQSFKFSSLMLRNCLTGTLLERFIMLIYLTEKTLCNFFLQKKIIILDSQKLSEDSGSIS